MLEAEEGELQLMEVSEMLVMMRHMLACILEDVEGWPWRGFFFGWRC